MLLWSRDVQDIDATMAAYDLCMKWFTPSGRFMSPNNYAAAMQAGISKRQLWTVHYVKVTVSEAGPYGKIGLVGEIIVVTDDGKGVPLETPHRGVYLPDRGLVYAGPPFQCTHGIGWSFVKGALADTDRVSIAYLYEPEVVE